MQDAFNASMSPLLAKLASSCPELLEPHPLAASMVADSEAGPLFKRLPNFMLNAGLRIPHPSDQSMPTYTAAVMHGCLQWYIQAEETDIAPDLTLSSDIKDAIAVLTVSLGLGSVRCST